jgi:(methylthio)acryloyl-CoA hydratase
MSQAAAIRSSDQPLRVEVKGPVLSVGIDRPLKRNALNDATVLALEACFSAIPSGIRVAVIHGIGEHFSAGLDLSELTERDVTEGVMHSRMWHRTFDRIQFGPVPVVAALKGAVIGGGLELAAACHIRVAEPSTFYALPEGQRGIFVGGGGSMRLPRLVGVARMADMMLTGRTYRAEEGVALGFSQYLAEDGAGLSLAMELAGKIAGNAPMTNFAVVQALPRIAEADPQAGLLMESLMASVAQADGEAKRRIGDFLAKKAAKVKPT